MGGGVSFRTALLERLQIISPTLSQVQFARQCCVTVGLSRNEYNYTVCVVATGSSIEYSNKRLSKPMQETIFSSLYL